MALSLQALKERLSGRPDSEHQQALVRVAMLVLVLAYLLLVVAGRPGVERQLQLALQFLSLEFLVSFVIVGWLLARPGISMPRRSCASCSTRHGPPGAPWC